MCCAVLCCDVMCCGGEGEYRRSLRWGEVRSRSECELYVWIYAAKRSAFGGGWENRRV
jgi:hypothetical protein